MECQEEEKQKKRERERTSVWEVPFLNHIFFYNWTNKQNQVIGNAQRV